MIHSSRFEDTVQNKRGLQNIIRYFLYAPRMDALQRTSSAIFYTLGALTIVGIVLYQREILVRPLSMFLSIIDLPLLFSGMLFGGSTLVSSVGRERMSSALVAIVFVPLAVLFLLFASFNFALPFQPEL